jgi:phosphate transport system substrate-binding protein
MKKTLILFLLVFLISGCSQTAAITPTPTPTADALTGRLTLVGSTTIQPLISPIANDFMLLHPNVNLDIAGGGSAVGISAVHEGTADIGMASRALTDDESKGISQYQIAIDVLAIVVHPDNPVKNLTLAQIQDIYFGRVTNWKDLGGLDQAIVPVQRELSSGSRGAFDEMVLQKQTATASNIETSVTAGDLAARVGKEEGVIGYVGFGNIDNTLKVIGVNGVIPNQVTAKDGSYPLIRPLILMTGPLTQPLAQTFIDYVLSPIGQKKINDLGWIPVK